MRKYDIKRGHYKNIEGDGLPNIIEEVFGSVKKEGEYLVSSYGAIKSLRVGLEGKKYLLVETEMDSKADESVAAETIKRYNEFLFRATGYTAKERRKKLTKV